MWAARKDAIAYIDFSVYKSSICDSFEIKIFWKCCIKTF